MKQERLQPRRVSLALIWIVVWILILVVVQNADRIDQLADRIQKTIINR